MGLTQRKVRRWMARQVAIGKSNRNREERMIHHSKHILLGLTLTAVMSVSIPGFSHAEEKRDMGGWEKDSPYNEPPRRKRTGYLVLVQGLVIF